MKQLMMAGGRLNIPMSDIATRNCKICGKEFEGHMNAKCCSIECRKENKLRESRKWSAEHYIPQVGRKVSVCVVCGKEFAVKSGGTITCSAECRKIRRKEKDHKVKKCTCAFCGKEFETLHIRRYCTAECRNKAKSAAALVDHPEKKCAVCGKTFKPKQLRAEYCSKQCQKKLYQERSQKRYAMESGISIEYSHKPSHIDDRERYARAKGLRYADLQKRESIELFARVELPEWAK